ncbi:MAG: DUF368 domain-containing protein [Pseudomonadales bacterium]
MAPVSERAAENSGPATVPRRGLLAWLALVLRGMAMGIAELVPGISGGTIAFVTGIYFELVQTLARIGPRSLVQLLREGPRAFWSGHNLNFLLVLMAGMLASVLLFARLLGYLLDTAPPLVWGFFFTLIVASVVQIGSSLSARRLTLFGPFGAAAGLALLLLEPGGSEPALASFFFGGMLAVSAWLLPAISGSFLLLVLGLYQPVLAAINDGRLLVLAVLACGCVVGIMAFSRLLSWLMERLREQVLCVLVGFMAGSLVQLWPWRLDGALLSPAAYEAAAGQPALVAGTVLCGVAGVAALWLLSRLK